MKRTVKRLGVGAALVALSGCQILFDLKSHVDDAAGGSSTGTSAGGTGTNAGGSGGASTSSGTVTGTVCIPGATEKCDYSGPKETEGVGPCKAPERVCAMDGTAWGMCQGEVTPKTEDCSKQGDEDCNFGGVGCSEAVWSKMFEGAGVSDIVLDKEGDIFLTGFFSGSVTFGGSPILAASASDVFVAALDSGGGHIWSKGLKVTSSAYALTAIDPLGNMILAGSFNGTIDLGNGILSKGDEDIFVGKFGPGGNVLWVRQFGGPLQDFLGGIAVDPLGDVVLAGHFNDTIQFDNEQLTSLGGSDEGNDVFLVKLSNDAGTTLWAKRFGDASGDQSARALAIDPKGNIFMAGQYAGAINFGLGDLKANDSFAVYLASIGVKGDTNWAKALQIPAADAMSLAVGAGDAPILAISASGAIDFGKGPIPTFGSLDVAVGSFSALGELQWTKSMGGMDYDGDVRIAASPSGKIALAFDSPGTVDFGNGMSVGAGGDDVLVATMNPLGDLLWTKRYGDGGGQNFPAVELGPKGEVEIACNNYGVLDFGNGMLKAKNGGIALGVIAP